MTNYRNIFNTSYNYIGLILIIIISLLIFILEKNTLKSIFQISKISFISGVITFIITLIVSFVINNMIPNTYKIFIQIITDNVINSLFLYSALIAITGGITYTIIKYFFYKEEKSTI